MEGAGRKERVVEILRRLNRLYCRTLYRVATRARRPLPPSGPAIVVANHTSGADPLLLDAASNRRIRFLMAVEYYRIPVLGAFFRFAGTIPVRRDGGDVGGFRAALAALRAGDCIGIFPRGGIHAAGPFKHGAVMLAARTGAPIVPAHIGGGPGGGRVFGALLERARVRITFGEPMRIAAGPRLSRAERERLTAELEEALEGLARDGAPRPGRPRRGAHPPGDREP